MFYGYGKSLYAVGCGDETTVAIGLFLIGVVLLDKTAVIAIELLIPLNGTKIGCLEQGGGHCSCRFLRL